MPRRPTTRSEPYPNKLVDLKTIGTDATLATAFAPQGVDALPRELVRTGARSRGRALSWPGRRRLPGPPLDGIWATAPYFHNGSVPTIYHVVKSGERPGVFTRSFRGEVEEYDQRKVGLKVQTLANAADPGLPAIDGRKVYDRTSPAGATAGTPSETG